MPKKSKTSSFLGVYFSKQKRRWKLQIRREGIQRLCWSELEAAMLYNAVSSKIWPDSRLNPTPIQVAEYHHHYINGEGVILLDFKEVSLYSFVEQTGKRNYQTAMSKGWFYRDKVVQRGIYLPETKSFQFQTLHQYIFGGPCRHLDGNPLNNRLSNLVGLTAAELLPPQDEFEAAEAAAERSMEGTGALEGSAVVIEPGSDAAFDQVFGHGPEPRP